MKQDVIKFLANPPKNDSERFNKAVSLYRQSKDHDVTLVRFLNSMGFSKDRLDNVLYELKKLHGVTDLEIAKARPKQEKVVKLNPEHEEIKAELKDFDVEAANYHSLKSMAAKVSKLTKKEPADQKGDTLKPFVQDAKDEFFPPEPVTMTLEEIREWEDEIIDLNISEATEESVAELFEKTKLRFAQIDTDIPEGISKVEFIESVQKDVAAFRKKEEQDKAKKLQVKDPVTETGASSDEDNNEDGPSEEFKKKLAGFDTDAEKYNSIKSFAAEVSEVTKEDPKDQKGDTLKAFIQEAKKKFAES